MTTARGYDAGQSLSWALYDWANSAFATTVMAVFFPIMFRSYWSAGGDEELITFRLGTASSLASIIVAALAPILGAIADRGNARKRFLIFFAAMGVVVTGCLALVSRGDWVMAAALFIVASIGFSGANIFYDSLIVGVSEPRKRDFVSALGYSLGYLGGGLLLVLNVAMYRWPAFFGLVDAGAAGLASFVSVAIWWATFSIPLVLFVKEPGTEEPTGSWAAIVSGFGQLIATFREIRKLRTVFLFLIAYWLYIDGVDTIQRMAMEYGSSLGFDRNALLLGFLLTQFVGFPAAIAFGKIGERLGARTGIFIGLGVYIGVTIWGFFLDDVAEFYGLALAVGLVQGGVQALSRSLYTQIIPPDKAAEFFGFYNMLGKFAAVIGPSLMGWVSVLTGNIRYSLLSIIVLFIAGALLLRTVDVDEGRRAARELGRIQ